MSMFMGKQYTTLGTDILDVSDYSIIATAKTNELAQEITDKMNEAMQITELKVALKPFAYAAKIIDSYSLSADWRDTKKIVYGVMVNDCIYVGDLRRAARALKDIEK